MTWKVTSVFDADNDGVGEVTCSYFADEKDAEPSFVHSARIDSKEKKELDKHLKKAIILRRKSLEKITKQTSFDATATVQINNLETGVVTSGNK